jgi:hypothetical protein
MGSRFRREHAADDSGHDDPRRPQERLVAEEKALIVDLRTRALGLKEKGVAAGEAWKLATDEF